MFGPATDWYVVPVKVARTLERELSALKAELAREDIVICELNRQLRVIDGALIQCEKDAQRYRWVLANPAMLLYLKPDEFDAAIAEAMNAKAPK